MNWETNATNQDFALKTGSVANQYVIQLYGPDRTFYYTGLNTWVNFVMTYDGDTVNLYANGVLNTSLTATLNTGNGKTLKFGRWYNGYFQGILDEATVWNKALSASEVTSLYNSGAGRVVQRDANTKLILHFDENGSDPRSANTAFDDSGNGNNGTIYGNAKYVSGLVGIDPSASSGQVSSASFASHNGVFIEEGTVNRIKNPSFESNVTDSWVAKPSINFTTSQTDSDGNALVGSNNIKDVFFYDTTKDSDGGAWRNNATAQASSWYNEAFSTTRGKKKEFPEKAYIVVEDTRVDIIDAVENKLWMRFINSGSLGRMLNMWSTSLATSVYALNGKMYVGVGHNSGLAEVNFTSDSGILYKAQRYIYNNNIANRNLDSGFTANGSVAIVDNNINDVSVAVISGKTYVAVATDGGVSVINETDGTVVNLTDDTGWINYTQKILFDATGNLYFTGNNDTFYKRLIAIYKSNSAWSSGTTHIHTVANAIYAPWGFKPTLSLAGGGTNGYSTEIKNIYLTSGTSIIDGTSNTIYIASDNSGLNVLQEKQGDEAHGSVKYYDKNHITEEMIGAIKGQWGTVGNN